MAYKIAFFGAKPYDIASFDKVNEKYNYDIRYYKGHLNTCPTEKIPWDRRFFIF